ncbi:hypothetical protein [Microbacterium sp. LWO12-1.2]|uniref:hypothetical protein n=1 Tax=Microbacterium sp. LWO12-1.2 TaxID=3135261 RepID=UPI0034476DAC
MTYEQKPQYLTSVLVEERDGSVTVTLGLGDPIPGEAENFGYAVDYYGQDGNGGKRFGVRFGSEATTHVFDWSSSTQANVGRLSHIEDGLVIFYPDAGVGLDAIGKISAFSHLNGQDVQTDFPVTLLR